MRMMTAKMRIMAGIAAGCAILLSGGCSSTADQVEQTSYSATMARPIAPDVYPVIEGKRPTAGPQMTNEQAAAQEARLSSLSGLRSSGKITEAEYRRRMQELDTLAANHGADTLKEIRN